ncbi:hypothetical protein ACU4GD_01360 [Cupriavidus basilensis]
MKLGLAPRIGECLNYLFGASILTSLAGPIIRDIRPRVFASKQNSAIAHVGMSMIVLDSRCARSVNSGLWPKSITRSSLSS